MLKYHIQTIEVPAAGASNITFSSIPQTYDDLLICYSARTNRSFYNSDIYLHFNNDTGANYSFRRLYGDGTGSSSDTLSNNSQGGFAGNSAGANATSNTFSNSQIYIPDYRSSVAKSWSVDSVGENNASASLQTIQASIWSGTSPITSISLKDYNAANFIQYSSASLYGIKRGATGPTSAYGGTVTTSGGYTYHTFRASGTFSAPRLIASAEMLVIGGGGAGGSYDSGGGGAGGLCYHPGFTVSPGSYNILIGAGGSGSTAPGSITSSTNSTAFGVVALGGGYGGSYSQIPGQAGGSGGGGQAQVAGSTGVPGAALQTSNGGATGYGNAGGTGEGGGGFTGGGGGGAGEAGNTDGQGAGGDGLNTWSTWATATSTGVSGFYAGGGAGGSESSSRSGGDGGGGSTYGYSSNGDNGVANTGSGGGGAGWPPGDRRGGNGGSGIVIIRYPTPA